MSTPEELLCRRSWRLRHSVWALWGILSAGLLWSVGFGIIGLRARNKAWLTLAAIFAVPFIIFLVVETPEKGAPSTPASEFASGVMAISWIAGMVVAFFVNRRWLVWLATNGKRGPWYATATAGSSTNPSPSPVAAPPSAATIDAAFQMPPPPPPSAPPMAAPGQAHGFSATAALQPPAQSRGPLTQGTADSATSATLDLNSATVDQLAALPGMDRSWASHIVATRERLGGFADPSDLVTSAGVQPHVFAALRGRLTASKQPAAGPRSSPDNPRGRRLEF